MLFFNAVRESQLGYCAIFACIGIGFLFLRRVDKGEIGPGYWAMGCFLNSLGFLFWSASIPISPLLYYLIGEFLHVAGFFSLVCGAYRFVGNEYRWWNAVVLAAWVAIWLGSLLALKRNAFLPILAIKGLRAILFASAGWVLLRKIPADANMGRRLAGWSLVAWGAYILAFAFVKVEKQETIIYGFLVGFQVLSAFGMVVMVLDKIRFKADESAIRADRLEGLLPICSYCKKIRDEHDDWQTLELYIEDRSSAEFSHGICPECMKKHQPDKS
jgi:hypothetical protein